MKLRNKLILSCAALAAVATTAVSTTYAWYTSNTTVTADGVSGTTKTNDDCTLLISTSGKAGSWGSKVSLGIDTANMVPVEYNVTDSYYVATGITADNFAENKAKLYVAGAEAGAYTAAGASFDAEATYYFKKNAGEYYSWTAASNTATGAATANTHYIQFSLYFKSGSTDSLSVKLTDFNLKEKAGNVLNPKMVLSNTGLTQSTAGTTYKCNMFRALTYVETIGASTEVEAASDTDAAFNADPTRKAYDVESFKTTGDTLAAGCNVHEYYNAVKNLTGADAIPTSKSQSETYQTGEGASADAERTLGVTGAGSLEGMSPILRVTYTIYLDGWDLYCFDACQGQSFTLDMEFQGVKVNG